MSKGKPSSYSEEQSVEDVVPAGSGGESEQKNHRVAEGLEVYGIVERTVQFHVAEGVHPDDGKDEHHDEQKSWGNQGIQFNQ